MIEFTLYGPMIRHAGEQDVGLAVDLDQLLLVQPLQCLLVDGVRRSSVHASHSVRRAHRVKHAPSHGRRSSKCSLTRRDEAELIAY